MSPEPPIGNQTGQPIDLFDWVKLQRIYRADAQKTPMAVLAVPLLTLTTKLRHAAHHGDLRHLRQEIVDTIRWFEDQAARQGVRGEALTTGRYVLCATLDEAVLSTPWGSRSQWGRQSLLSQFHNETWAGEKVFSILNQAMRDPERNVDLLTLIDLCLLAGFQGRYRLAENGRFELQSLRRHLHQLLHRRRPAPPKELSANWQPTTKGKALQPLIPLWAVTLVFALVVLGLYSYFQISLLEESEDAATQLEILAR